MADTNPVLNTRIAGRFEAEAPFDTVVDPGTYYKVEAVRTLSEMEGLKIDVYTRVFKPVGVSVDDYPTVLARAKDQKADVVSLVDRNGVPVYVISSFLKSFPIVNGVSYERMCLILDLGPCDPSMKDIIAVAMDHCKGYIESTVGITATPSLGTIPTLGYVSAQQHETYEKNRQSKIKDSTSDVQRNKELEAEILKLKNYIVDLEARLED